MTFFTSGLAWLGAALAVATGLAALLKRRRTVVQWTFMLGMLGLGLESAFSAMSLQSLTPAKIHFWQMLRVQTLAWVPFLWLVFSLAYSRGNYRQFLDRWRWICLGALVALPYLAIVLRGGFVTKIEAGRHPYEWHLQLGPAGLWFFVLVLLLSVAILMNLERTLRASVGTMRWRVKYMVLGLGCLFGVRIYTFSQSLLYSSIDLSLAWLDAIGLVLGVGLIVVSLLRVGLHSQDVYPSQSLLHYSFTGLLVGGYLLLVGLMAKLASHWGGQSLMPWIALFIVVSLMGMTMLLLSERVRLYLRRQISRHLRRPFYDYRQAWLTLTERTASLRDRDQLCRSVVRWISDTLDIMSVNLWLLEDSRGCLVLGASSSLNEVPSAKDLALQPGAEEFLAAFLKKPFPVALHQATDAWCRRLETYAPHFFTGGTQRFCVPLVAGHRVLGLITLSDAIGNRPYSTEDLDLLKCVADQVATYLLNFQLAEHVFHAKEMEAFQMMSAFFVHDLKNTASTLSLMLKNMPQHFDDPAFRDDALRGLGKCVTRINDLISRLGMIRESLDLNPKPANLNDVARAALGRLSPTSPVRIQEAWQPLPDTMMDPDQIQKVVLNLLHNAVDAMNGEGEIRVATSQRLGWTVLSVSDQGCGMSQEFIARQLFRPFQTTKKKGIGVGLFLSRRIVEAHGGKLEVESQPGRGSVFQLWLPQHPATS